MMNQIKKGCESGLNLGFFGFGDGEGVEFILILNKSLAIGIDKEV